MVKNPVNEIVNELDKEVDRLLSRHLFWEFCLYYDRDFFERRQFLRQVADGLQQIADGHILKLSVSMSPRAGKSYITSLFCAWWLARNPTLSVMRNTCTATLYEKFSYDVRNILRSKKFNEVFPEVWLADDKQNLRGWNLSTAKQVSYFGAGVGGTIIGFGANLAVSDDLYSGIEDALSENYNEKVLMWKQGTHDSRKERGCPEIFIGTRWSTRDVIGQAMDKGDIDVQITIPALTPDNKSFCEDVKTTAEYLKIRSDIDSMIWEAEYMQEPAENKGLLFPKKDLNFYNPDTVDVEKLAEFRYMYVDPADTGGDDLAAPFGYLIGDKIYLPDVICNNYGTDVNEPECVEQVLSRRLHAATVESNGAWILFAKNVRAKVQERWDDCDIRVIKNSTNKETRIFAQSAFIRNHFVFNSHYEDMPQYARFMKVLCSYLREGKNKHDDAPDSLAGMAAYFQTNFSHLW